MVPRRRLGHRVSCDQSSQAICCVFGAVNMQKCALMFDERKKVNTERHYCPIMKVGNMVLHWCNSFPPRWLKRKHSPDKSQMLVCPDVLEVLTRVNSLRGQLHNLMITVRRFYFCLSIKSCCTFGCFWMRTWDLRLRANTSKYAPFVFPTWVILFAQSSWEITMSNTCPARSNCVSTFVPQVKSGVECDGNRWWVPPHW